MGVSIRSFSYEFALDEDTLVSPIAYLFHDEDVNSFSDTALGIQHIL